MASTSEHPNVPRLGSHPGDLQCLWILLAAFPLANERVTRTSRRSTR